MSPIPRALRVSIVENGLVGRVAVDERDGSLRFFKNEYGENKNDVLPAEIKISPATSSNDLTF